MSFLAPFLFALAAFAAIPLLLHLIRRKRVRILDLPTFRYLQKAAMEQRLHLRLQDRLLMLLRILVLLLLALAFMGPTTESRVEADLPLMGNRTYLVLDDSLSMQRPVPAGTTLYNRALGMAETLLAEGGTDWRFLFASDLLKPTSGEEQYLTRREDLAAARIRHGSPEFRGRLAPVIRNGLPNRAQDDTVWVLTDGAAMNWPSEATPVSTSTRSEVDILLMESVPIPSNWAATGIEINNEPLLAEEPALLTVSLERFGEPGPSGTQKEVRFQWRNSAGVEGRTEFPLEEKVDHLLTLRTPLEYQGEIESVSAGLETSSVSDPFTADNSIESFPASLRNTKIGLLAATPQWEEMLEAALVGFEVVPLDISAPPSQDGLEVTGFVILLGEARIHADWTKVLRQRVESGAGLLVLFDRTPEGIRRENWTDWWTQFGSTGMEILPIPEGSKNSRGGSSEWFSSALDPTAMQLDWAGGSFSTLLLEGFQAEWLLETEGQVLRPVFLTRPVGEGTLAYWAVPIDLAESPLILSPGWVPLLSQMTKRTLIADPRKAEPYSLSERSLESDLSILGDDLKSRLSQSGWSFHSADRVLENLSRVPSRRFDWTTLCLILCLALGLVEIAVSNYF